MSEVTLEQVQAKQAELAALIARLTEPKAAPTILQIPAASIELQPGEHYAGTLLNDDGTVRAHLVLMAAQSDDTLAWQDAMDWAKGVGGELPSRQEMALLFANCREHMEKDDWQWSRDTHDSDASYAWYCGFDYGYVDFSHKSYEGRARAVRRVNP